MSDTLPPNARFFHRDRSWHPPAYYPDYKTSVNRAPSHAPITLPVTLSEATGPVFGAQMLGPHDADLIHNFTGAPALGPRIIVQGRVLDEEGRPQPDVLIEIWQANAGGRYRHPKESYIAPLDPNFGGAGRTVTGADGSYAFRTVQPGPYPWPNRINDWRPAHIHFSLFGRAFAQRLITQMYFEGDPMIWQCPIAAAIPSREGVETLIAELDRPASLPMDARAYRFDIILRGARQTHFENRTEGA